MTHTGICPCCKENPVPNNCYYCSRRCSQKYNRMMKRLGANSRPTVTGRTRLENPKTRRLEMETYTAKGL